MQYKEIEEISLQNNGEMTEQNQIEILTAFNIGASKYVKPILINMKRKAN